MTALLMTGPKDGAAFNQARTIGGLLLLGLVAALSLIDAASDQFHIDSIQLALILGSALVLLGVEAGRKLMGGGGE